MIRFCSRFLFFFSFIFLFCVNLMAFAGIEKMINGRMIGLEDPLQPEDINYVLEVGNLQTRWLHVGLMLGVEINELRKMYEMEFDQRLTSVYHAWLNKKTYPYFGVPTLKRLACVLGMGCGGRDQRVAGKLLKAFEEKENCSQVNWETVIKKEHESVRCSEELSCRIAKKLFLEYRTYVQQTLRKMESVCVDIDALDDVDHFFAFLNDSADIVQSWDVREALLPVLCALLSRGGNCDKRFLLHLHVKSEREFDRLYQNNKNVDQAFVFCTFVLDKKYKR